MIGIFFYMMYSRSRVYKVKNQNNFSLTPSLISSFEFKNIGWKRKIDRTSPIKNLEDSNFLQ